MAKSIMQGQAPAPFFTRVRAWLRALRTSVDPIAELMVKRVGMVQRGEYEPLGTIYMLATEAGWIQFPTRNGPALARFADGQIDLLDEWQWNYLPDRFESSSDPCPDCAKAPCNECHPKDATGGDVYTPAGELIWPGERICSYGTQVECCGGAGVIAAQDNKPCTLCGGTGKVQCRKCRGTAQMSTGYEDWDNDLRGSPSGKFCPSCGGSGRARIAFFQDLLQHLHLPSDFRQLVEASRRRPIFCLGPIHALMVGVPGKSTQPWRGSPDSQGNWPHILSKFDAGARAVILSGVLRPEIRTRGHMGRDNG